MVAPLHERIADDLRARILSGALVVGAAIPSESELQLAWHGSRAPIRQALATLRAEGLIAGGRGKPPVVQRQQLSQSFDSLVSFTRWVEKMGRRPGQRTVEIGRRPADEVIAGYLGIQPGEQVVHLRRLRLIDDEPVMVERATFTLRHGGRLLGHDVDSGSIYAFLIATGLQVGVARHIIDAVPADDQDSEMCQIPVGTPLMRERRIVRTRDGEIFEYSDDRYLPHLVTLTIDNRPGVGPVLVREPHSEWLKQSDHQPST